MPIVYHCPNPPCRKKYHAADALAGRLSRCKQCQTTLRIPHAGGDATWADPPAAPPRPAANLAFDLSADSATSPRYAPRPAAKPVPLRVWVVGGAAVAAVVVAVGLTLMYAWPARTPDAPPPEAAAARPESPPPSPAPAVPPPADPPKATDEKKAPEKKAIDEKKVPEKKTFPPKATDPALNGTWKMSRLFTEYNGTGTQSYLSVTSRNEYTFRDGRLTQVNNGKAAEFDLETDTGPTPHVARWFPTGTRDDVTTSAIYEFRDGALWLCTQIGPVPPAFGFKAGRGELTNLYEFTRVGPAPSGPGPVPKADAADVTSAAPPPGWLTYTSRLAAFHISFPSGCKMSDRVPGTFTLTLPGGTSTVTVSWETIPAEQRGKAADEVLDARRDKLVAAVRPPGRSELQTDRKLRIDGRPGRELVIHRTGVDAGGAVVADAVTVFRGRVVVAGNLLVTASAFGSPEHAAAPDTIRILETFGFPPDPE